MKKPLLVFSLAVILLLSPGAVFAEENCEEKKLTISQVLKEGNQKINRRIDQVNQLTFLSEDTRSAFTNDAAWLRAWLNDQSIIITSLEDCSTIPDFVKSVRLQLEPVQLASRKVSAASLLWRIDTLFSNVDDPELNQLFGESRTLLQSVRDKKILEESRLPLRRAVFLLHQILRKM